MRGFLAIITVVGLIAAAAGGLFWLVLQGELSKPAVVVVPQLILAELGLLLGLLLAAVAGGLGSMLDRLDWLRTALRETVRPTQAPGPQPQPPMPQNPEAPASAADFAGRLARLDAAIQSRKRESAPPSPPAGSWHTVPL
jgi:hypothetical protein